MTTKDEILAMDADALRLAIGEIKGATVELCYREWWKVQSMRFHSERTRKMFIKNGRAFDWPCINARPCPDWPVDLCASFALVGEIEDKEERDKYANLLADVVIAPELLPLTGYQYTWSISQASAEQRARAWLLWKATP